MQKRPRAPTGLITICLVLVKPPLWVDGLVTLGVCVGLWGMYRPTARRAIVGERVFHLR